MKILHLVPAFYPKTGGIETFSLELIQSLQARGHENKVVASHSGTDLPDQGNVGDVQIDRVPFLPALTNRDPKGILLSKIRLAQIKRDFQPDIVHLHIGGPMAFLHLQTADVAPAPLVITIYDLPEEPMPSLTQVLQKADRTAVISQARLDECRLLAPDVAEKMELVYAGRPSMAYSNDVVKTPAPTFLLAGRQVLEKGFAIAIKAYAKVDVEFPDARLVLAGDGPQHEELKTLVHEAGLSNVVDLPGRVSTEKLAALYQSSWAGLVPSLHSESFGLVALEAMQAGTAVIASRIGGLQEVVADGESGYLFEVGDAGALASYMIELCADPSRAIALGLTGKLRAKTLFDWENCVDAYDRIYGEVS